MLQILATFPPICKNFGLFFSKLPKYGLLLCQNSNFGVFGTFLATSDNTIWQLCSQITFFVLVPRWKSDDNMLAATENAMNHHNAKVSRTGSSRSFLRGKKNTWVKYIGLSNNRKNC